MRRRGRKVRRDGGRRGPGSHGFFDQSVHQSRARSMGWRGGRSREVVTVCAALDYFLSSSALCLFQSLVKWSLVPCDAGNVLCSGQFVRFVHIRLSVAFPCVG